MRFRGHFSAHFTAQDGYPLAAMLSLLTLLVASLLRGQMAERPRNDPEPSRLAQRRPLADRLPDDSFHVVAIPPFVVIGNESRATVERRAAETVDWAVKRLRQDFFPRDPAATIEIWLLKDAAGYREHSRQLFGIEPTTPFGYFSQRHQALVMDISTGGGTLVHELVHPLMAANFPECPAWFDEGLASLYEQCGDRNGRIWGHPNWRLRGLQRAIGEHRLYDFQTLCQMQPTEFYQQGGALGYAQARYLCFYLQEMGKLREYYHRFHAAVDEDPSGYRTLCDVLNVSDAQQFQRQWSEFILRLKFPAPPRSRGQG